MITKLFVLVIITLKVSELEKNIIYIYYNNFTASAAEQSLSKFIKINLICKKSAGLTAINKYIKLSDKYGIEIPIKYMGSKAEIFHNKL